MLTDRPGQQPVGGGRRASTLRSRVRGVRKFLSRTQQGTELSHVVRPTVRVPSSETLGTVQQESFEGDPPVEEMVGTLAQERLTGSALYGVIYRELRASAQRACSPPCCFFLSSCL